MIAQTLYRLKLQFGVQTDVYRYNSTETNFDTGERTRSVSRYRVRRAVKMPEGVRRQQYISPYMTQTNKPFLTKGLGWDEVTQVFLFDGADLRNFNFELEDWIVWNHERYEIKAIEELADKAGWMIGTTRAKSSAAEELHIELVEQSLGVEDSASEIVE